jgi:hypothetical protein
MEVEQAAEMGCREVANRKMWQQKFTSGLKSQPWLPKDSKMIIINFRLHITMSL